MIVCLRSRVNHESERGQRLRLTLAPCLYGDFVAEYDGFAARPDDALIVLDRIEDNPVRRKICAAPPSPR